MPNSDTINAKASSTHRTPRIEPIHSVCLVMNASLLQASASGKPAQRLLDGRRLAGRQREPVALGREPAVERLAGDRDRPEAKDVEHRRLLDRAHRHRLLPVPDPARRAHPVRVDNLLADLEREIVRTGFELAWPDVHPYQLRRPAQAAGLEVDCGGRKPMSPRLADEDPRDEGPLADLTSGALWTVAGLVGTVALLMPGADRSHLGWALGIAAVATGWGLASLVLWRRRLTMTLAQRAAVTAGALPLVGLAIWASGGAASFVQPLMLFTALFIAYFFPPHLSWPLTALFAATYASPLLYEHVAGYPSRVLTFSASVAGMNIAIHMLKQRLLRAEARQRAMAERDPLTGLSNRRTFDAELARAVAEPRGAALVLFDLDGFKGVNDDLGHPVGDAVLRVIADACSDVIREGDCLARIGGDEFAVVAPGAGVAGVNRLVSALEEAIAGADLPPDVSGLGVSFASAVAPVDAVTAIELLDRADQRLLTRKRAQSRWDVSFQTQIARRSRS
jgi:diguanylate cyclase (GGDEF)-like protein